MADIVKHKGTEFNFGERTLIVPPLNLRALEQLESKLKNFTGGVSTEQVGIVADVALAALQRNYPEITRDEVCELIDLGNMADLMSAVMGVSGLIPQGEVKGTANQ